MALTIAQLLVRVNADTAAAQSGLGGLSTLLAGGGGIALGAAVASAAVAGIGIAATKMAGDFQAGIVSLETGAGESHANLKMVSDGILQMAKDTGTSTKQLTDGMYMIESGGYHGAAGLAILKSAAEGAKVGNADLGVVADATDTILKNFGESGMTSSQAVNTLITTVANGKTHMQDLASSLSQILPTASAAGIGLQDAMGAMATMTGEGVDAANAATYLRQTMIALSAPSTSAKKALEDVGLTSTQVSDEMHKSLPAAIQMITDAVGKKFPEGSAGYIEAIKNISGGSRQMQGMLDLSGQHMKTFNADVGKISDAATKGGNSITGWTAVQGTFNQRMDKAREVVQTLMIQLGEKLLPVAGKLVDAFTNNVIPTLQRIGTIISTVVTTGKNLVKFFQSSSPAADAAKVAVVILTGALLGFAASAIPAAVTGIIASVTAFGAQTIAAGAAAIAVLAATWPFILAGAAIALLAVGIFELVKHWSDVEKFFGNVAGAVGHFFQQVGGFISTWGGKLLDLYLWPYREAWTLLVGLFNIIKSLVSTALHDVLASFQWLYEHNTYVKAMVDGIHNAFTGAEKFITDLWHRVSGWLVAKWDEISKSAEAKWNAIVVTIESYLNRAWSKISSIWNTVVSFLAGIGESIWKTISDAWNKVMTFIGGLVGRASDSVKKGVVDPITDKVSGLAGDALHWGENLINMLVQGIENTAGKVGDAAKKVAGNIGKFLGFHSPAKEGPGADADQWMPNLGNMLSDGLTSQQHSVGRAASRIAAQIAAPLAGLTGQTTVGVSGSGGALALPTTIASYQNPAGVAALTSGSTSTAGAGGAGSGQPIVLQVDGRTIARAMLPHLPGVIGNATGNRTI